MNEPPTPSEITRILQDWNDGGAGAVDRLLPMVYDELKRQARLLMSRERSEHTLQPTALVHEAFIRLSQQAGGIEWENRTHFYGIASRLMRHILVDHARRRSAVKRGEAPVRVSLDDLELPFEDRMTSILIMDSILERLAQLDERQAELVEMKFFGGLSDAEIGDALNVSRRTIVREWRTARLWLLRELNPQDEK